MGAIIGSQAGPLGAAVGAGTLLIYSAITGEVPLQGSRLLPPGPLRGPAGRGARANRSNPRSRVRTPSRPRSRQSSSARRSCFGRSSGTKPSGPRAKPRKRRPTTRPWSHEPIPGRHPWRQRSATSPSPSSRRSSARLREGKWGNEKEIDVVARSLDADRDGNPEEVRYHDAGTGRILRKEEDKNYDGTIDTWSSYESGVLVEIQKDNNEDGEADEWQRYGPDGRMAAREVDRNYDGRPRRVLRLRRRFAGRRASRRQLGRIGGPDRPLPATRDRRAPTKTGTMTAAWTPGPASRPSAARR